MNEVHGHSVMEMMLQSGKVYTRETLKADILEKFGEESRYFTCSASEMTADALIDFLASKDKFVEVEGGFKTEEARICKH